MTPVKLRPALPGDLPELTVMVTALAAHHGDDSQITPQTLSRDLFADPPWVRVLVAQQGPALAGYAALLPRYRLQFGQRGMDLHHLYVNPTQRGQGLGRRLIEASMAHAERAGCVALTVGTDSGNHHAQRLYEHIGFQKTSADGVYYVRRFDSPTAETAI